ncbi:papain-like cysteine protease family protein [Caballeronia sp. LjRoot29]|uniref:papain-like cysteine protease family protein n=1 Tax=Caballeronia sp. LjRoot29 TaxID=3342315 RepID=UPI003F50343C
MPPFDDLPHLTISLGTGGFAAPRQAPNVGIQFPLVTQQKEFWCWAAVSLSMRIFYQRNGNGMQQCQLAQAVFPGHACCSPGYACDEPAELELAMKRAGVNANRLDRALNQAEITQQINDSRPVGVRVAWDPLHGHFVSIYGIYGGSAGDVWIEVADPDPDVGEKSTLLTSLTSCYRGTGYWSNSYLTG